MRCIMIFLVIIGVIALFIYYVANKGFSIDFPLEVHSPLRDYIKSLASKFNNCGYVAVFHLIAPLIYLNFNTLSPKFRDKANSDDVIVDVSFNYFYMLTTYARAKGYGKDVQDLIKEVASQFYLMLRTVYGAKSAEMIKATDNNPYTEPEMESFIKIIHARLDDGSLDALSLEYELLPIIATWGNIYILNAYRELDKISYKADRYLRNLQ